jgi:hypothetical protein
MARLGPDHRLYQYAEYRLSYLAWKVRVARAIAGQGQTLAELNRIADQSYQSWAKTGREADCRKAWCMNRVLQQLGPEVGSPPVTPADHLTRIARGSGLHAVEGARRSVQGRREAEPQARSGPVLVNGLVGD